MAKLCFQLHQEKYFLRILENEPYPNLFIHNLAVHSSGILKLNCELAVSCAAPGLRNHNQQVAMDAKTHVHSC